MNNPYAAAKKPARKGLFTRPLEDFDDFEPGPTGPEKMGENELGGSDQMHSQSGLSTGDVFEPITQQQNAPQQKQAAPDNDNSPSEPQTTSIAPMSVPLPLWKRLPSNIISYSSAEILTLAEVCRYGMLYRDRSVRTTGVLLHKYIHEKTGEVSVVLQDPLYQLSSTASTKKRITSGRRISFGPTNLGGDRSTNTKPRPKSLGMTASRNVPSSILSATKKAPIVATNVVPQAPFIGLLQRSTPRYQTPGLSSDRKRPLSSLNTPKSAKETLVSSLADHPNRNIWVVVDPNNVPVSTLTIGDLVTVFGIVLLYDPNDYDDDKCGGQDVNISSVVRQLGKTIHQQRSDEQGRLPENANHAVDETNSKVMYIAARILRQDNGANLRLQQEALQVRRKYVWQTHYSSKEADNNSNNDEDVQLFPGCGPPPYSCQTNTPGK